MSKQPRINFDGWPHWKDIISSILNAYSQIFFSNQLSYGLILLAATFLFPLAGLAGLTGVIFATIIAFTLGFDRKSTINGLWGFNVLLTTLPLGLYYEPGIAFFVLVLVISLLTFLVTIAVQGILFKYHLPFLSMPFVLVIWIMLLATRQFESLHFNEHNIYQLNQLYDIGGTWLIGLYEWFQDIPIGGFMKTYLVSLSAIFFQNSVAGGLMIAVGLLLSSRISLLLSLLGFAGAYGFYILMGIPISPVDYTYIGFNFILTAIAIGGFFHIPTKGSFLWVLFLTPVVGIFTVGFSAILDNWQLSVYALPFNLTVILFIYVMKWRTRKGKWIQEVPVQHNSPEKNLYAFENYQSRFQSHKLVHISLPIWGEWLVSQAHNGEFTHQGDWQHAWDFVLTTQEGKTYRNEGTRLADFLSWDKPVLAPADGYIVEVQEGIPDNPIGDVNLKSNWGNTVITKHADGLYSKLGHFRQGSIQVKKGDWVKQGTQLGTCGNSGRSPEPHIHFQLQETPYVDSKTMNYPISYYLLRKNKEYSFQAFDIPEQGQHIQAPETNQLLKSIFNLIPGQQIDIDFELGNITQKAKWEVLTTQFNESYIICRKCGAKAYYKMDGQVFYFLHYEGSKKSALYHFYLAVLKLPLFYGKKVLITDQFPPNLIFPKWLLFFQDLVAPFVRFIRASYELQISEQKDLFSSEKIELNSAVRLSIFDEPVRYWKFNMEIDPEGLLLTGNSEKYNFIIKWVRQY